ncbi:MAG: hypothetical protein CM1200mP30_14220 [Pseudomonadota bacterium]|nr:MAG: hypothetical protein CM1200mP30_14220 [Pseudomonadota bacterium]
MKSRLFPPGGVMMDKSGTLTYPMTWKKPPYIKNGSIRRAIYFFSALYLAAAFGTMDVNWTRVAEGFPRAERFLGAFFPPILLTIVELFGTVFRKAFGWQ